MKRKQTRLDKSTSILANTLTTQWCYVNTENEFTFMNRVFEIDEEVVEYKVFNKAKDTYDYTNEAKMDSILVIMNQDNSLSFFNQDYDPIEKKYVKVKFK